MLWHGNGIHGLDIALNGPGRWKDLFPHFFRYLSWGRTSRLLFRLGCLTSPRKRHFLPFFAGLRCHHTDEWRASQSSRYHSKCHNWTRFFTILQISQQMSQLDKMHSFFPANIVRTKIWGRTMLTEQFSLKCDHQRLFLWRQFLGLVTPEYICISPSMESTN